jgi:formate hydrogenlyase subunit 4
MGLAFSDSLTAVASAIATLFAKMLLIGVVVVAIETTFAKLRLYKIADFIASGLVIAVLAVFAYVIGVG